MEEDEIDITKLKYVLYARKSSDDPQKQLRSIDDQIAECLQLADRLGLHIVGKPLREEKSAKKPGLRPIFSKILSDLRKGLYDGILAWNPDRLARNMKEGGTVIDMVDEGYIKDLKFVTHPFTNTANGKMLLGMAFVLSKQYSDDLSQKVTRGVRNRLTEGKTPIPKHGYINEDGVYRPDGRTFNLICKAWEMRRKGISLEEISQYMNNNGYFRIIKKSGRKVFMDKRILSIVFNDPFYYGVLVQAKQKVDLCQVYGFQPAVSEEVFFEIQQSSRKRQLPIHTKRNTSFYPLRMMVKCSYCDGFMYVAPSTGELKRYLYFRCDNKSCKRKKRSIRSKVVFDYIYTFLKDGLKLTEGDYKKYYSDLTKITEQKRQHILVEIHNREGTLKRVKRDIKDLTYGLLKQNNSRVKQEGEKKILELEVQEAKLEGEIADLKSKLGDPEKEILSLEQFLNLSKNAAVVVRSANPVIKDKICRRIFVNVTVDEIKVLSHQLKEPFETMVKTRQGQSSRGEQT
jgi:site-specific DNA recombinase